MDKLKRFAQKYLSDTHYLKARKLSDSFFRDAGSGSELDKNLTYACAVHIVGSGIYNELMENSGKLKVPDDTIYKRFYFEINDPVLLGHFDLTSKTSVDRRVGKIVDHFGLNNWYSPSTKIRLKLGDSRRRTTIENGGYRRAATLLAERTPRNNRTSP